MSLINSIKNAGGNVADFGGDVVDNAKKVGGNVADKAEDVGSAVAHGAEVVGSTVVDGAQATEHAAVSALKFQGNAVRFGLEKTLDAGKTVGSAVASGFDRIAHPGNPNPPAAQGLEFSETKSATILAYRANKGETYEFPDGKQWKVVDLNENKKTGFRAVALQPVDPNDNRTIVAFAGTDPKSGKDWATDVKQGVGLPTKQYKEAVQFADKWKAAAAGDAVTLTGHSLGGGLASYASIKTGLHATALNSAPLAPNHVGGNRFSSAVRNNPNITQYYVPGEVLTNLDIANPLDVRPGNKIAVQGKYSTFNPLAAILNHSNSGITPNIPDPKLVS